uniref:Uncharacterized protein n=1 Tax=Setaria digitata TaxID=48799 RepID=A0A915PJ76_9BILA
MTRRRSGRCLGCSAEFLASDLGPKLIISFSTPEGEVLLELGSEGAASAGISTGTKVSVSEGRIGAAKKAWRSIRMGIPFANSCVDVDPQSVEELLSILEQLNRLKKFDDANSLLEYCSLSDLNKQHILHLWRAEQEKALKWGIDVVVANSTIRKSLHPKVWVVVNGEEVEMNLEVFANLRYEVSRALSQINRYGCT